MPSDFLFPIPSDERTSHGDPIRMMDVQNAKYRPHSSKITTILEWDEEDEEYLGFTDKLSDADAQTDFVGWMNGKFFGPLREHIRTKYPAPFRLEDGNYVGIAEPFGALRYRIRCWERRSLEPKKQ